MARLIGYDVKDGKLTFWCYPGEGFYVPEVKGVVPDDVLLKGADAIEAYVESIVLREIEKIYQKMRADRLTLEQVRVPLETLHGAILLRGVLTHTIYSGLAVWDIHLTEPLTYEGRQTLYRSKYAPTPQNELLKENLAPTNYAIAQGKKTLIAIYERRKEELRFPIAYRMLQELKIRKGSVQEAP